MKQQSGNDVKHRWRVASNTSRTTTIKADRYLNAVVCQVQLDERGVFAQALGQRSEALQFVRASRRARRERTGRRQVAKSRQHARRHAGRASGIYSSHASERATLRSQRIAKHNRLRGTTQTGKSQRANLRLEVAARRVERGQRQARRHQRLCVAEGTDENEGPKRSRWRDQGHTGVRRTQLKWRPAASKQLRRARTGSTRKQATSKHAVAVAAADPHQDTPCAERQHKPTRTRESDAAGRSQRVVGHVEVCTKPRRNTEWRRCTELTGCQRGNPRHRHRPMSELFDARPSPSACAPA